MTNALLCLISRFTDCTGSVGAPAPAREKWRLIAR
jgi:hypothetical protein